MLCSIHGLPAEGHKAERIARGKAGNGRQVVRGVTWWRWHEHSIAWRRHHGRRQPVHRHAGRGSRGPAGGGKGPGTAELGPARQPCSCTIRLHFVAFVSKEFKPDDLPPIEIYRDTCLLVKLMEWLMQCA